MFSRVLNVSRPLCRRSFSTEAAKVDLPIQLFGLPATYANALFKTATRANALPAVEKDLASFKKLIESSEQLKNYLNNPVISRKDKAEDINKISAKMSDTTRGFLGVLAENGRLGELTKIMSTFDELMKAKQGIVEATVVSAQPLTKRQLKEVEEAVTANHLESGKKLQLNAEVDPSILGGLQLQIADKFLDLSIQSRINKLHQTLSDVKN
mmetsp:Transcript_16404/g.19923  ORF Transcript_16404/g.19923 Transcript_16404/m.19923 type:complete len:211 (+) Transcript_16404:153-785(+)